MAVQPYGMPYNSLQPYPESAVISNVSSNTNSKTGDSSACITFLKALGIALLGAVISVAISVPVTITLRNSSTSISARATMLATITASTGTVTTTTSASTTSATTSTSSSTTSVTTATTATTVTTTTTTTVSPYGCAFPCLCADVAPFTSWQVFSAGNSIYMNVDTSRCNFTQTPLYFTSIDGIGSHYWLTSYGSIYSPTSTSFRVYLQNLPGWNSTTLMGLATTNFWNLNWFALYY